jgi:hypothetical protein
MRHLKGRLVMLVVGATTVASVVAASEAEASGRHIKKHHQRISRHYRTNVGFNDPWATTAPPVARQQGGDVCPGSGRSFDCKVWPPPFDQDPDRKISGSDGGG